MMQITFIKKEKDKHALVCKRNDGTSTWKNADEFFLQHDLCIMQLKQRCTSNWLFME